MSRVIRARKAATLLLPLITRNNYQLVQHTASGIILSMPVIVLFGQSRSFMLVPAVYFFDADLQVVVVMRYDGMGKQQ